MQHLQQQQMQQVQQDATGEITGEEAIMKPFLPTVVLRAEVLQQQPMFPKACSAVENTLYSSFCLLIV